MVLVYGIHDNMMITFGICWNHSMLHFSSHRVKHKVTTYAAAISDLENAGEVNLKLSMHTIEKVEGSGKLSFTSTKNVCFLLDPVKQKDPKKAKKAPAKSFKIMTTILDQNQKLIKIIFGFLGPV